MPSHPKTKELARVIGDQKSTALFRDSIEVPEGPPVPPPYLEGRALQFFNDKVRQAPWLHESDSQSLALWCEAQDEYETLREAGKNWSWKAGVKHLQLTSDLGFTFAARAKAEVVLDRVKRKWREEYGVSRKPKLQRNAHASIKLKTREKLEDDADVRDDDEEETSPEINGYEPGLNGDTREPAFFESV
jgi:hypothetical protein